MTKCTYCPRPSTTTVLDPHGPNGRRNYPACAKCAAERTPAPKAEPVAFTVTAENPAFIMVCLRMAKDGDVIEVTSNAVRDLAERMRAKNYPNKKIEIVVKKVTA
jgi:hypothetical protein